LSAQRDSYGKKNKTEKHRKKIPHRGNGIIKGKEKYNNNKKEMFCVRVFKSVLGSAWTRKTVHKQHVLSIAP
jgi:hypothetical protein